MKTLSFWQAILITLGIIIIALGYITGTSFLGLNNPWIAFLALTIWGAMGMKMTQAPGVFLGGAVGLLISFSMTAFPQLYGEVAILIPFLAMVLAISCMIKGYLPLICNYGLFIFMTLGSAGIVIDQQAHLSYLPDLAFGALVFWLIPWLVLRLRSKTKLAES